MKLDTTPFDLETSKRPIAARITLGRQPPDQLGAGFPVAKDRFWITSPIADGVKVQGKSGARHQQYLPLHPDFARWNYDPFLAVEQWDNGKTGETLAYASRVPPETKDRNNVPPLIDRALSAIPADRRQNWRAAMETHRKSRRVIRGNIVHRYFLSDPADDNDAAFLRRSAQEGRGGGIVLVPHPQKLPACVCANGRDARRWNGTKYETVPCKGSACPLTNEGTGPNNSIACGKVISLVFQLRWPVLCWRCTGTQPTCPECKGTGHTEPMPSAPVEIECSGPVNIAAASIESFFKDIDRQWATMNLPESALDYVGLPFTLTLSHKVGGGKDYWTVTMAADFPAGHTFQTWAWARAQANMEGRAQILDGASPLLLGVDGAPATVQRRHQLAVHPQSIPGECE